VINQAIDRYHALVDQANLKPSDFQGFTDQLKAARIMYGDRVSVEYLRAQFLSPEQEKTVRHACETIWSALDKLSAEIPRSPRLKADLGLIPREQELADVDPGYPGFSLLARFDSFMTENTLQFVELNAECPAGPAYTEVMAEVFRQHPVMQAFEREYDVRSFNTRDKLLKVILETWEAWGGQGSPQVAIVDWAEVSTYHEFELCKAFFEGRGVKTLIEDPRKLTYDGDRLRASDGTPIDLVYRRVLTNEFIQRWDEVQPLFHAYRDGKVCVINPFRSKYLHKKMIFGLLTDGQNQSLFNDEERGVIARHIPWTRKVRQGETDYQGKAIDLPTFIREHRDRLVLKPNDDYGGKGIFIGWESSADEWDQALEKAIASDDYVVQEKVTVASAPFPTVREGVVYDQLNVDLDPFIWKGQVEGFLTRLSGTALCNVTSGGGIVPTFVISPRNN
jgi:uncharacterized circularly permuted ATP-grasp superfamily protein